MDIVLTTPEIASWVWRPEATIRRLIWKSEPSDGKLADK